MINFLRLMKKHHHFEYQRHHVREKLIFVSITISFVLIDIYNLLIYAMDLINFTCNSFHK